MGRNGGQWCVAHQGAERDYAAGERGLGLKNRVWPDLKARVDLKKLQRKKKTF